MQIKPYKKFLLVEDGSVEFEKLKRDLKKHNPEIRIIVYRAGAAVPQLIPVEEEHGTVAAIGFVAEEEEEDEQCTNQ